MSEPGDPSLPAHYGHHGSGESHVHSHGHLRELEQRFTDEMQSEEESRFSSYDDANSYSQTDMEEELEHYEAVLGSIAFYEHASRLQFHRLYRQFMMIPEAHQQLFDATSEKDINYIHPIERIKLLHEASTVNMRFLATVLAKSDNFLAPVLHASPQEIIGRPVQPSLPSKNPLSGFNADKLHSTLCQLAREWSSDGAEERLLTFTPLLQALETYLPVTQDNLQTRTYYLHRTLSPPDPPKLRVICPGSGLGRLPLEICLRGYQSMGNEFSYFMLILSNFILNKTQNIDEFTIYPWIHQMSNIRSAKEQLQPIKIPDIEPFELPDNAVFGCAAGDFLEIARGQIDEWDAVVTCFFLDTANNIVAYIEAIWATLKPGAYWINIGPLLYHFADSGEPSLELTLDQVLHIAGKVGFELVERKTVKTKYAAKRSALMNVVYDAEFWVARKPSALPQKEAEADTQS